jgi:hypothetical protein
VEVDFPPPPDRLVEQHGQSDGGQCVRRPEPRPEEGVEGPLPRLELDGHGLEDEQAADQEEREQGEARRAGAAMERVAVVLDGPALEGEEEDPQRRGDPVDVGKE